MGIGQQFHIRDPHKAAISWRCGVQKQYYASDTRMLFLSKTLWYALTPRFECRRLRIDIDHHKTALIFWKLSCLISEDLFGSLVCEWNAREDLSIRLAWSDYGFRKRHSWPGVVGN
jgi:hypothetical protein